MSRYQGGVEGRRRGGEEESESYFISMSDLMAGVLFLFIIMLTNFALQIRSAPPGKASGSATHSLTKIAQADALKLEQAKAAAAAASTKIGPAPPPDARAAALLAMGDYLKARRIDVTVDVANGALRFPNAGLFQGTGVSPGGQQTLAALGDAMRQVLPCFAEIGIPKPTNCPTGVGRIGAVFVEGHSDTGSPQDWAASVAQGSAAFQGLMQAQPELQKLQTAAGGQSIVSVSGYGPTRPVQPGDSPDARKANSRLDVRLVLSAG